MKDDVAIPGYICRNCGHPTRDLSSAPRTADGRVIPSWDDQSANDLAFHIGSVVMAGSELDLAIAALAAMSHGENDSQILRISAQSGTRLRRELRGAQREDVQLAALLDRYETLYELRNHVAHSFRPARGQEQGNSIRLNLRARSIEEFHIVRNVGMAEMIGYWYEVQDLLHDVRELFLKRALTEEQ